jgi:uncharacterized protein with HEPN domain
MPPLPREFLQHIQQELEYLEQTRSRISREEFTSRHGDIPWSDMAKLRDKLIHPNFGIDYELVWSIVDEEIPTLESKIAELLDQLD